MLPMRTLLFVPASRENMVRRAHETPADVIVLDLEDGVAPDQKDAARANLQASIASLKAAGKTVHVRVNHLDTGMTRDDLIAAIAPGLDGLLFPKAQSPAQIRELDVLIREQEYHKDGVRPGDTLLIAMIETARGVLRCEDIALASTRIAGLALGGEDYCADLGIARTTEGDELTYVRNVMAHVCAANGLRALDTIFAGLEDPAGLRADAARARALGFKGKYVVHPAQVEPVNEVFSPTTAELESARRIVSAFDEALAGGIGVVRVDDRLVDAPIARRARDLIAYAEAINGARAKS